MRNVVRTHVVAAALCVGICAGCDNFAFFVNRLSALDEAASKPRESRWLLRMARSVASSQGSWRSHPPLQCCQLRPGRPRYACQEPGERHGGCGRASSAPERLSHERRGREWRGRERRGRERRGRERRSRERVGRERRGHERSRARRSRAALSRVVASASVASGTVAHGAVARGAVASGANASGADQGAHRGVATGRGGAIR